MGTCCSKKISSSSPPPPPSSAAAVAAISTPTPTPTPTPKPQTTEEISVKKEIFVIKQRKSHERRPDEKPKIHSSSSPSPTSSSGFLQDGNVPPIAVPTPPIRTSSCTKEEVDAILIQCGRLSRSSSGSGVRKYSGSKRSFDFDQDNTKCSEEEDEEEECIRPSHRRTPSREKDGDHKRSGSARHRSASTSREEERKRNAQNGGGSTSRRLSRSPGRRSETTPAGAGAGDKSKGPAKMVSVPPSTTGATIKRVSVKRTTASPRSQSPANTRENPSLSHNSSRKQENSPYRRNPLGEIDDNCLKQQDQQMNNKEAEEGMAAGKKPFHFHSQKPDDRKGGMNTSVAKSQNNVVSEVEVVVSPKANAGTESHKPPQTITRSRSSRRSRDLDFLNSGGDDVLVNVPTSYASILLEDIQNFHQKNSNSPVFSLPPCVSKACSILDAVADLNSSTTSNISNGFSEDRSGHLASNSSHNVASSNMNLVKSKDPFVETEVFVYDDIMEPSIHKYITVRRGAAEGREMEQQESSGSNSFVGQQWFSNSSWEPNSADSTDRCTSSSNTGEEVVAVDKDEPSLNVSKKKMFSETGRKQRSSTVLNSVATGSGKKRELDQHQQVTKAGARSHTAPIAAAASM